MLRAGSQAAPVPLAGEGNVSKGMCSFSIASVSARQPNLKVGGYANGTTCNRDLCEVLLYCII